MKFRWIWLFAMFSIWLVGQGPQDDRFRTLPPDFFTNTVYENPDFRLNLGGAVFDPLHEGPGLENGWQGVADDEPTLHLIQFQRAISKHDLARVRARGLQIIQTLRPFTIIVWGQREALPGGDYLPSLRWSGAFEPGFKVLPHLRNLAGNYAIQLLAIRDGKGQGALIKEMMAMGGSGFSSRPISDRFAVVTGHLNGEAFVGAANHPSVYTLQRQWQPQNRGELSAQLIANNLDGMNQAVTGYPAWLTQIGLDGTGLIMACVDSGVKEDHPDLLGQFAPCVGPGCAGAVSSGHGTHVAGIMGGTGVTGVVDPNGFLRAMGVAPGAQMIEQNYLNLALDPGGILALIEESFANGALLSNNSWGLSPIAQGYDIPAMELDLGVRDADPVAADNQAFNYILAIDNGNGGVSTIGSPDEAKNAFTVGATQAQMANTAQVPEFNNLASVTAHGPALDGRNVPLIVAPGCQVESAEPNTIYRLRCGTSMAAPHVAGSIGLFFEYYRDLTLNQGGTALDPSPALVKAAFLPVAVDLAGFMDADGGVMGHRFDAKQGWGRLTLPPILQPVEPVQYYDNPRIVNNTGEIWRRMLRVSDNTKPVKMMLVWTDAPGHGLGGATAALNNDLDLEVSYNGQTYLGNVFNASGWSTPGGTADALHNTEGVLIGPTATGNFEVSIKGTDINSDAVPGPGSLTDQDFALVCYNCEEVASFSLNANPDTRDVCAPQTAIFDLDLQAIGGFSSPVTFSLPNLPAGLTAQFSQNPATPTTTSTLTISDTDSIARGSYEITVLATAGGIERQIILDMNLELALPDPGVAIMPADMALDQPLLPSFSWQTLATADSYRFELSEEMNFASTVLVVNQIETTLDLVTMLTADTTYYWRVAGINLCGQGSFSPVRSFQTRPVPPILLVDDDNNTPDVLASYTQALDALGLTYDLADTQNSNQEPVEFGIYQAVLWFSGAATDTVNPKAGPLPATQDLLATYLDQGGSLFISSQSYFNDLSVIDSNFNTFMADYLGVANGTRDAMSEEITGTGSVFNGIGPEMLSVAFGNGSDALNPNGAATLAFLGDQGNAAVQKETANYKTCYLGFALEGLSSATIELVLFRWFGHVGFDLPCRTQADLMAKLPGWSSSLDLAGLIDCVTAIGSP